MKLAAEDAMAAGGVVCLTGGAAWVYAPAGPIVLGVILLAAAVLRARRP